MADNLIDYTGKTSPSETATDPVCGMSTATADTYVSTTA